MLLIEKNQEYILSSCNYERTEGIRKNEKSNERQTASH